MGTKLSRRGAAQAQNAEQPVPDSKLSRSPEWKQCCTLEGTGSRGKCGCLNSWCWSCPGPMSSPASALNRQGPLGRESSQHRKCGMLASCWGPHGAL